MGRCNNIVPAHVPTVMLLLVTCCRSYNNMAAVASQLRQFGGAWSAECTEGVLTTASTGSTGGGSSGSGSSGSGSGSSGSGSGSLSSKRSDASSSEASAAATATSDSGGVGEAPRLLRTKARTTAMIAKATTTTSTSATAHSTVTVVQVVRVEQVQNAEHNALVLVRLMSGGIVEWWESRSSWQVWKNYTLS